MSDTDNSTKYWYLICMNRFFLTHKLQLHHLLLLTLL